MQFHYITSHKHVYKINQYYEDLYWVGYDLVQSGENELQRLHGVISHTIELFTTTAVRASNFT
jgi:hypothetical protein